VTGELEARWNKALARVAEVEAKIVAMTPPRSRPPSIGMLTTLAANLKSIWTASRPMHGWKKRIVRTVIHEVIAI